MIQASISKISFFYLTCLVRVILNSSRFDKLNLQASLIALCGSKRFVSSICIRILYLFVFMFSIHSPGRSQLAYFAFLLPPFLESVRVSPPIFMPRRPSRAHGRIEPYLWGNLRGSVFGLMALHGLLHFCPADWDPEKRGAG